MGLSFCPTCGMLLQIEPARSGRKMRLFCPTCPYVCPIDNKIVSKVRLVKKEVEPVISQQDNMENASKTAATCPKCQHGEALYKQIQIRSADEPMTIFYKCCKCKHDWREE